MKRLSIVLILTVSLALASVTIWHLAPISDRFFSDAETIHIAETQAHIREILWQPPRSLPDVINLPDSDVYEPRLSADGLTIYFVRGKAGPNADIYSARRANDGWTEPQPLTAINSDLADLGPEPASDDQTLYFYSNRPGGLGGYDLWVAHRRPGGRTENDWLDPVNLGPGVNSVFNEYGPAVTPDGTTLYFASNRPQVGDLRRADPNAWSATLREDLFHRTYDLYEAAITDGGSFRATPIGALNTVSNEGAPAVSAFGDFLYFSSDRPGGKGGFDLYRSRRLRGGYEVADNLGETVNTPSNELDPGLSLGGYRLFFSSDRNSEPADPDEPRHYKLFYTTSREVFRDVETRYHAPINWAAWWLSLGPGLVWLFPALLALLALLWFMRGMRERELNLLTKCLLASLFAHLLLLLLFSLWQVTASLAGEFQRGEPIRVALAAPSTAHDIAGQVLGGLTDVTQPNVVPLESTRRETRLALDTHLRLAHLSVERSTLDVIETPQAAPRTLDAAPTSVREPPRRELPPETVERSFVEAAELATPDDQRRVSGAEVSINLPDPAPTSPAQHADTSHTEAFATAPSDSVETPVLKCTPDAGAFNDTSLAQSAPARDATLTALPPLANNPRLPQPPLGALPIPDTNLSDDVATRAAPHDEPQTRVEPAHVQTARAPLIEPPPNVPSHAAIVRVQPTAVFALEPFPFMRSEPRATARAILPVAMPVRMPKNRHVKTKNALTKEDDVFVSDWQSSDLPHNIMSSAWLAPNPVIQNEPAIDRATPLALPDDERAPLDASAAVAESNSDDAFQPPAVSSPTAPRARALVSPPALLFDQVANMAPPPLRLSETDEPSNWDPGAIADAGPLQVELEPRIPPRPLAAPPTSFSFKLDLPSEQAPPTNPYAQRTASNRLMLVERNGGSVATEHAVERALAWLARHQHSDGHWDAASFDVDCGQCGGETKVAADVALTGLSTLCFLGAGHTHRKDGPYRDAVARSLRWLVARQRSDGDLRADETMYTHGIATIALSEARAMTGDTSLTDPVERAIRFIYRSRNRDVGGWRYDPGQAGDTSVLGWQVMALKSAAMSGLPVPGAAFEIARRWLDTVEDGPSSGRYAYKPGRPTTPSMTAEAMFVRQLLGHAPGEARMRASAEFVTEHLPDWDDEPNTYFWYYASLALYQHGGEPWAKWNAAVTRELLAHQRSGGGADGSWNPDGEWAALGGRVYQTAICTLILEVYYRYLPLYSPGATETAELPDDVMGTIRGSATDAETGAPIADTVVRLIVSDGAPIVARTDTNGDYALFVPEMPDFFALSASHDGYVPRSKNVNAHAVRRGSLRVDFDLHRQRDDVIVLEAVPEVHHLGDDRFDGRINSRFQKSSEGSRFETTFYVKPNPETPRAAGFSLRDASIVRNGHGFLPGAHRGTRPERAEVRMLVKGVQRRHRIAINGTTLNDRLDDAPSDGSFGEFRVVFDPTLLRAGTNTFAVIAKPSSSDIDDFEFVNVRIQFFP